MHVSNDHHKKLLTCNHCKKPGHTKAQCYRLIGFPATFKFTKTKKEDPKPVVHNATVSFSISQDQYHQLVQMLQSNGMPIPSSSNQVSSSITDGALQSDDVSSHLEDEKENFSRYKASKVVVSVSGNNFANTILGM